MQKRRITRVSLPRRVFGLPRRRSSKTTPDAGKTFGIGSRIAPAEPFGVAEELFEMIADDRVFGLLPFVEHLSEPLDALFQVLQLAFTELLPQIELLDVGVRVLFF